MVLRILDQVDGRLSLEDAGCWKLPLGEGPVGCNWGFIGWFV